MKHTQKGFTLVELLVVIAILAILATVSVVGYTSYITKANESVVKQELAQIKTAVIAEDINNKDFDVTDGKVDENDVTELNDFLTSLKTNYTLSGTITDVKKDDTTVTYTIEKISATWNLATGEIKIVTTGD